MTTPSPELSLVLLSFRSFEATTGPCLASLGQAEADPRVELILVDNGSDDGASERCAQIAERRPGIRFAPQATNLGFAGGMNAGVTLARGEWVCLVNSDTLFPAGALAALMRTLHGVPAQVASVGPVTNAAGNGQRLPLPGVAIGDVLTIGAAAMRLPTGLLAPTYRSDFFCVAIRRAVWHRLGGLDTDFGLGYYDDFDFSLRLAREGWQQVVAEDVFVAHLGSATFAAMGDAQRTLMRRNRALMQQRHPGVRFESARQGNAQLLRGLLDHADAAGWTPALRARAAWRLAALEWDEPRSPLKRWLWRRRQSALSGRLRAAGIAAEFPKPVGSAPQPL